MATFVADSKRKLRKVVGKTRHRRTRAAKSGKAGLLKRGVQRGFAAPRISFPKPQIPQYPAVYNAEY
jgi:hypothetical protein